MITSTPSPIPPEPIHDLGHGIFVKEKSWGAIAICFRESPSGIPKDRIFLGPDGAVRLMEFISSWLDRINHNG